MGRPLKQGTHRSRGGTQEQGCKRKSRKQPGGRQNLVCWVGLSQRPTAEPCHHQGGRQKRQPDLSPCGTFPAPASYFTSLPRRPPSQRQHRRATHERKQSFQAIFTFHLETSVGRLP